MRSAFRRLAGALALSFVAAAGCGDGGSGGRPAPIPEKPSPSESASATAEPPAPAPPAPQPASGDDRFAAVRREMVSTSIAGMGITDERVLQAMREVPRHRFVPEDLLDRAYQNRALPIGFGQTISQPYVVALMTELLDVQPGEKILEIGTGSGYQGAVLTRLTNQVWSIEIIPELARRARSTFQELGYDIEVKQADGYFGWPEHAPFDGIIVTAAPDHMPQPLIQQLAEGGKLVVPVGPPGSYQTLWRVTKSNGKIVSENITDVIFVPLVRERG